MHARRTRERKKKLLTQAQAVSGVRKSGGCLYKLNLRGTISFLRDIRAPRGHIFGMILAASSPDKYVLPREQEIAELGRQNKLLQQQLEILDGMAVVIPSGSSVAAACSNANAASNSGTKRGRDLMSIPVMIPLDNFCLGCPSTHISQRPLIIARVALQFRYHSSRRRRTHTGTRTGSTRGCGRTRASPAGGGSRTGAVRRAATRARAKRPRQAS
jgi:hypothetical protein